MEIVPAHGGPSVVNSSLYCYRSWLKGKAVPCGGKSFELELNASTAPPRPKPVLGVASFSMCRRALSLPENAPSRKHPLLCCALESTQGWQQSLEPGDF